MSGNGADSAYQNWQDAAFYEGLLRLERRCWAWPWLQRDEKFAAVAADIVPPTLHVLRREPPIVVGALIGQERLEPWGLLFRGASMPRS